MKLKTMKLTDTECVMAIDGITSTTLNAIRRTLVSRIPRMAIEDVDFHIGPLGFSDDDDEVEYESVAPLYDEMIAHRLGLVPIPTDFSVFRPRSDCKCGGEGCPLCTIMYSINKRGPCTIFSGDLEPVGGDESTRIKDDLIPIVKLKEGQAMLVYATAEMGYGSEHSKWQSAMAAGYQHYPIITIDDADLAETDVDVIMKSCPMNVFGESGGKLVIKNQDACNQCMSCAEVCEERADGTKAIQIGFDPNKFIMRFETDSGVIAKEVFVQALHLLQSDYDELIDALKTLK